MLMFDVNIQNRNSDGIIVEYLGAYCESEIACDGGGNRMLRPFEYRRVLLYRKQREQ